MLLNNKLSFHRCIYSNLNFIVSFSRVKLKFNKFENLALFEKKILLEKVILLLCMLSYLFSSCKKDYSCTCRGYTTQQQIFTDEKTVKEFSKQKAEESCIRKAVEYPDPYYPNEPNKIVIVNCDLY